MSSDNNKPDDKSGTDESYHFGTFKKLEFEDIDVSAQNYTWNPDFLIAST